MCERQELLDSLDEALRSRVTLIVAPAGFGKTTLLAQWCERLAERQVAVAYLTVSARDRDPTMFLAMIAAALARAGIELDAGPAFEGQRVREGIAVEDLLLALELAGQPTVLVIDDFERVNDPTIAALMNRFIEAAPDKAHLVIASRIFPAIPLSALELEGQLRLIDTYQLRLRPAELAWLLELQPDAPEVSKVIACTRGWPVTAELYRLWRRRQGADGEPASTFGGHVAEVQNYLTEQLFSSLPSEQLQFLIDISDGEEVWAELADAMRGRQDSAALLADLAHSMSSLMWCGQENGTLHYRVHPLLLDHLRQLLARNRERRRKLGDAAATYYLQQRRFAEAVRAAVETGDASVISRIVDALRPAHILVADGATALRLILRELPDAVIAARPRLRIMAVMAHFKAGFFAETREMLDQIRASTANYTEDPGGHTAWLTEEGCLLELILLGQLTRCSGGDIERLHARMIAAAPDDPVIWASGDVVMTLAHQVRGDLHAAEAAIERARAVYSATETSHYAETQVAGQEALVLSARGRLRQAQELIGGYQRQPDFELPTDASAPTLFRIISAAIRYEQDFSEAAVEALQAAFGEHRKAESWFDQYAVSLPPTAMRLFLREGLDAVLKMLANERTAARRSAIEALPAFIDMLEIRFRGRSDVAGAEQLSAAIGLAAIAEERDELASLRGWRELDMAMEAYAVLCLVNGRPELAETAASRLAQRGREQGRLRATIKGSILRALALEGTGAQEAATDELRRAIVLAYPERFVAPFAEEGERLLPLLERVRSDGSLDGFARQHAEAVGRGIVNALARGEGSQLNRRELEIVGHLAEGLSNKVIARRMGITEHTVKFHLKKVFAKLGVSSRRAAVTKLHRGD